MAFLRAIFPVVILRGSRLRLLACAAATCALLAPALRAAPDVQPTEYQLKAALLFNFTHFVDLPTAAFADEHAPIVIGILGEDPFGSYLDDYVSTEKIGGRSIIVKRYRTAEEITRCHVLFVSGNDAGSIEKNLERIKVPYLLTVGDSDHFNRAGGMIRFVMDNGKIRLRVNMDAVKASGLTLSSKLLRWATIVPPGKD